MAKNAAPHTCVYFVLWLPDLKIKIFVDSSEWNFHKVIALTFCCGRCTSKAKLWLFRIFEKNPKPEFKFLFQFMKICEQQGIKIMIKLPARWSPRPPLSMNKFAKQVLLLDPYLLLQFTSCCLACFISQLIDPMLTKMAKWLAWLTFSWSPRSFELTTAAFKSTKVNRNTGFRFEEISEHFWGNRKNSPRSDSAAVFSLRGHPTNKKSFTKLN